MVSQEKKRMLARVGNAIDVAINMSRIGNYVDPRLSDKELENRRLTLQEAKNNGKLINFPEYPTEDYQVVVAPNKYELLLACTGLVVVEAGVLTLREAQVLLKDLYDEEMGHLTPALRDSGLKRAWMGVAFVPVNAKEINVGGFVQPVGNLRLETVVSMYVNIDKPSQTDLQMINLLTEIGLTGKR